MALQFVTKRPFVTSNIIGATTMAQLQKDIGSVHVHWPEALERAIETIHLHNPNPCP